MAIPMPGAASQRTDLGPDKVQPIRVPGGQSYGEGKRLEKLQQMAKLPVNMLGPNASTGPRQGVPTSPQTPQNAPGGQGQPPMGFDPHEAFQAVTSHPGPAPAAPQKVSDMLGQMASAAGNSPDVAALARLAQQLGI